MTNNDEIAIVYMVAGMSSRFGGKIKQFAKVTEDKTLIEYSLEQAIKSGFNKICFIVGKMTEKPFREKFGKEYKGVPVVYALQTFDEEKRMRPWGTVDALTSIKGKISCPFVICNGDDIYGEKTFQLLYNHLKENKHHATVGYKLGGVLPEEGEVTRGIIEAEDKLVSGIKEVFGISKQNLSEKDLQDHSLSSMNIFAFHPEIITELENTLNNFKDKNIEDKKIECILPIEINNLIKENKIKVGVYNTSEKWFGVTNPGDELKVQEEIQKIQTNL
jgi:NDP-sugar pyrophosphorylase family protein